MSAHVPASLPAYLERELAASLEKLGLTADSEEGQGARERLFAKHQNKLQAARLRRANKKAANAAAEPSVDADDEKNDNSPSCSSVIRSHSKQQRKLKMSPASPEAAVGSSEHMNELATPKTCQNCGTVVGMGSSPDTSPST